MKLISAIFGYLILAFVAGFGAAAVIFAEGEQWVRRDAERRALQERIERHAGRSASPRAASLARSWVAAESLARYRCMHPNVEDDTHRCPDCKGVLRRCCDSIVGPVPHRTGCLNKPIPDDDQQTADPA